MAPLSVNRAGRMRCFFQLTALPLLSGLLLNGCQTVSRPPVETAHSPVEIEPESEVRPEFRQLQLSYAFQDPVPLMVRHFDDAGSLSPKDGILPVSLSGEWPEAELRIDCPHPSGDREKARLTLKLMRRNRRHSFEETWILAVPRSQIELLVEDLHQNGFFRGDGRPGDDAELKVTLDGRRMKQNWREDGRLLELAHRTLTRGRRL